MANLPPNTLTNADGTPYAADSNTSEIVDPAIALTAFMGWLTSRDEVAGPFSARHEAGQAVLLVKKFCQSQGWEIDDKKYFRQIKLLKAKYPD